TLDLILNHHEPYPAVAVTPVWDLVHLNAAATRLFPLLMQDPTDPAVLQNVMHAAFHPSGFRQSIVNCNFFKNILLSPGCNNTSQYYDYQHKLPPQHNKYLNSFKSILNFQVNQFTWFILPIGVHISHIWVNK
ncbi:MAG: hypothetical protein MI922_15495, partial [Bacteroidales bacterium]|nr:hypothetical protein [Bacteroidales bacterium]